MTPSQLQEIRERCLKVTEGPWLVYYGDCNCHTCKFITHARTDIPALLNDVERLQSANAQLYAILKKYPDELTLLRAKVYGA